MIDPLPLIFLSIALVPGTADSVTSTEGMAFRVHIEPDVVDAFNYRDSGGFTVHFKPSIVSSKSFCKILGQARYLSVSGQQQSKCIYYHPDRGFRGRETRRVRTSLQERKE